MLPLGLHQLMDLIQKDPLPFASIESGVGRISPIRMKINTPIPNHLKSVVLAKPPLLLLFESLIYDTNVAQKNLKINSAH